MKANNLTVLIAQLPRIICVGLAGGFTIEEDKTKDKEEKGWKKRLM